MSTLRSLVAALAVAFGLCTSAQAQISRVPNTGCSGASYARPTPTTPKIGTTITINGRLCPGRMPGFLVLGVTPVNLTVGPPVSCGRCVLGTLPLLFVQSSWIRVPIPIPNERRLIGGCFYVQTGCVSIRRCLELDGTLKICITA